MSTVRLSSIKNINDSENVHNTDRTHLEIVELDSRIGMFQIHKRELYFETLQSLLICKLDSNPTASSCI